MSEVTGLARLWEQVWAKAYDVTNHVGDRVLKRVNRAIARQSTTGGNKFSARRL